jgi:hypothetical protein
MRDRKCVAPRVVVTRKIKMTLPERYPDGRLKPGHTANPSGRPRVVAELRDLAREHTPNALKRLIELMASKNEQTALAAVRELLDRGYGKPVQSVEKDVRKFDVGAAFLAAVTGVNKPPAAPGDGARVIEGAATEAAPEADW